MSAGTSWPDTRHDQSSNPSPMSLDVLRLCEHIACPRRSESMISLMSSDLRRSQREFECDQWGSMFPTQVSARFFASRLFW